MNSSLFPNFATANLLSDAVYYLICGTLSILVLLGIHLMSKVNTSRLGNKISALAMALGIILTLIKKDILPVWILYPAMAVGTIIGLWMARKVKMTEMPQFVAFLNGIGGAASAIVGAFAFVDLYQGDDLYGKATASLAIAIGTVTFSGSMIAAGKLHKLMTQKPVVLRFHKTLSAITLVVLFAVVVLSGFFNLVPAMILVVLEIILAFAFGIIFCIRVGGADMPITISLLNSFSGVAGAIAGLAINDILLVSVGGIVGASGLFLTQIMCRAMNRKLGDILLGKTTLFQNKAEKAEDTEKDQMEDINETIDPIIILKNAKKVIIVPGYGMALAQAQHLVKKLADTLVEKGATVKFAIHPVAGRMPGHMNVLLCEADVDYDDLNEMDNINEEFKDADATIVVGANDILNPAARNAEGTPIYGMPILNVDQCKNVLIFNYDLKPGYSGVENPIYNKKSGVCVIQGDASVTLAEVLNKI